MSTLTSADFGELKRPTTRIHAPPGGGSSWSFGFGGEDAPQPSRITKSDAKSEAVPPPAPVAAAPVPAPAPAITTTAAVAPATAAPGVVRIAVLKTKVDAEIVDAIAQNVVTKLAENALVRSETFTVATLDELPYAASKLTRARGFDAVIAVGFLNTSDVLFDVLASTLTQAFIDISVANVKPVVRGLFIGEPRVASVKARGGYGAEFAESIDALVRLGGFVGPIEHFAEGKKHVTKPMVISRGNVLPPTLLSASRSVLQMLETLRTSLYEHGARYILCMRCLVVRMLGVFF